MKVHLTIPSAVFFTLDFAALATGNPLLYLLAVLTLGAGAWAMRPPADQPLTTVVFARILDAAGIEAAIARTGVRLVWADAANGIALLDVAPADRWRLYGRGALLVGGSALPAGCFGWSRPDIAA